MRELLVKAVGLHQRGAVAEAEALYRQVLRAFPRNQDALRLCGIACSQQGKDEEAGKLLTKAVQVAPTNADAQNALGKVLNDLGRHEDAEKHCQLALKIKPKFPEAYDNLGNALLASSRAEDAEKAYRKAIALSPKSAAFWSNLGSCLIIAGRYDEAAAAFLEALRLNPKYSKALRNLASILQRVVDADPILDAFGRTLDKHEQSPTLLLDYSDALIAAGRAAEALPLLDDCLEKQPGWAPALFALATAHLELNHAAEAIRYLDQALGDLGEDKSTAMRLGSLYSRMGDFDEAEKWFLKALSQDPKSGLALYNLANIKRIDSESDLFGRMIEIADDETTDPYERARTSFGAADVLDREKQYDDAFRYYAQANNLTNVPNLDWNKKRENLKRFESVFTPAFYEEFASARNPDATPIFVVGMPRSGTTLTEQILARHSMVVGAGEMLDIPRLLSRLGMARNISNYPEMLDGLTNEQVEETAAAYLKSLRGIGGDQAERIVDKLPGNAWYIGWIHLLFPNAKIVHCKRNPMDIALSCYRASFSSLSWGFRLEHIAQQIDVHLRAMEVWRTILPGVVFDLSYEDLVSDPAAEIPKLIEAVGLPWDPLCLDDKARASAQVKTASVWQVRQPISTASVEGWRRYEKGLEPLREMLVEFGHLPRES